MKLPLLDFLTRLATDPDVLRHFHQDQDAAMRDAGLPDEIAALIREKKVTELQQTVRGAIISAHSDKGSDRSARVRFSMEFGDPPPTAGPVSHHVILGGFVALVPLGPDCCNPASLGPFVQFNVPTPPVAPMPATVSPAAQQQPDRAAGQGPRNPPVPPMPPDH
jgi:hypothetical protein